MNSRLQSVFESRKAFVAYLTAGHKNLEETEQAAIALAKGGVDILEIGIPFSDPIADGPVIQAAMNQALSSNTSLDDVLSLILRIKTQIKTSIVLFTYLNPLLVNGLESTLEKIKAADVDGILVVDLPLEESKQYLDICNRLDLKTISLISPSTPTDRLNTIIETCTGFLYYVCRQGITGVRDSLPDDYVNNLRCIKHVTTIPVVSGFGIGDRRLAKAALAQADGFVVGSAIVKAISNTQSIGSLTELAQSIDPR